MNFTACLAPLAALRRHCQPAPCTRSTARGVSPASRAAIESVLMSVMNASKQGVTASRRVQKHHDRLLDDLLDRQLPGPTRALSCRELSASLERLEAEYVTRRSALRATANAWTRDWMMGTETFASQQVLDLHRQIDAADVVVRCAREACHELASVKVRPASL